jgi:hypothetical protein
VLQRKIDSIAASTLWTGTIGFFDSNYLVLCVVSSIGSTDLRFGKEFNATENFCSFLAIFGLVFAVAFPIILFLLIKYNLNYLNPHEQRLEKISQMVAEYKGDRPGLYT